MAKRSLIDWLEIATALAVLVGLGLVVMEIRVNTAAVHRQATVDRAVALTEPFFYSDVVRAADDKVRQADGPDPWVSDFIEHYDMTEAEALAWTRHLMQLWIIVEGDYYNGESDVAVSYARAMLSKEDSRRFVEHWRFSEEFRSEIDRILAEQTGGGQ